MQLEENPESDIIPDMQWSEDEQAQTQSSGDTEIIEEQLHIEEDIQSQQQKEKEYTNTQEPVSLRLMEVVVEENPEEVVVTQELATPIITSDVQGTQEEDTATQEPVSLEAMDVAVEESPKEVAITQEPTTLIVNPDVQDAQKEDAVPQELVSLPLINFIDLDSDQEEHHKEEILDLTAEVSILRMEVIKWKSQVEEYQRGMISLNDIEILSGGWRRIGQKNV